MKFLSQETIDAVKKVSVYEVAEKLGFQLKRQGAHWNLRCPNPNHHENTPDTYIKISNGYYKCYGGGGCGPEGDAINFYSWNQFGGFEKKRDFARSVEGIAQLMGIPIKYQDGTVVRDGSRPEYVPREQPKVIEVPAASADICDRTYRRFLDLCPVYDDHLAEWLGPKRQYTKEQIGIIGLRSVPKDFANAKKIVDQLIAEGYQIERVPGFTQFLNRGGNPQNEDDWYWLIAGMGKYYIPVRDEWGRIVRLRIRTNFENKKKYIWFSSGPINEGNLIRRGGAGAGAPSNVVVPASLMAYWEPGMHITDICKFKKVIITEGEHKAYIVANKLGLPVCAVPGVGNFHEVVPLLKKWGVEEAAIAYDIDAFYDEDKPTGKNENVFKQLVRFGKELISQENIRTELWAWNPSDAKGLDDLILANKYPVVTDLRTNERLPFVV